MFQEVTKRNKDNKHLAMKMLTRHGFTNCLSSPFIRLSERLWKIGSKASPQLICLSQWWQKVFTLPTNYRSQIFTFARNCGYIKEKLLNKLWFVCHRSDTFGLVLFYATRLASPPRQYSNLQMRISTIISLMQGHFTTLIKSTLSCVLRKFRHRFVKRFAVKTVIAPRMVV